MRTRIRVRDLRVTDGVFTVWGEGPIALQSVQHDRANGYTYFKRVDGWTDQFQYSAWSDETLDFTNDATMTVWRKG